MLELIKLLNVLVWIVGGLLLLTGSFGPGIIVLLVALFISVAASAETRKRREEKLIETTTAIATEAATGAVTKQPTTSDRLAELDKLKASEQISEDEYHAKRKSILDGL